MGDADSDISEEQLSDHISEAPTSESGHSDNEQDDSRKPRRGAVKFQEKKASGRPNCCMCESQRSEYQCIQCGRLTFCLKCCVSLHDNKFLGCHNLEFMDTNEALGLAELHLRLAKPPVVKARDIKVEPEITSPSSQGMSPQSRARFRAKKEEEEEEEAEVIDREALETDRRIIHSRMKELKSSVEFFRRLEVDFVQEKDANRDSATTACDAIKKKFDILRNLISAKEDEFLSLVKSASKERSERLNKGSLDLMAATSELDGYVTHTESMVDRLQMNPRMFNTTRGKMLEESEQKLQNVEDTIQKFQDVLDEVRGIPLGIHLSLECAVDGIQKLDVPPQLTHRHADPPHFTSIPANKFTGTPGVKVVRQQDVKETPGGVGEGLEMGSPARRGLAAEIRELQKLPMVNVTRAQSPAKLPPPAAPVPVPKIMMYQVAAPASAMGSSSNLLARTAARKGSPKRMRTLYPPELEALKKQVAAQRAGGSADGRSSSRAASPLPIKRSGTPTRITMTPPRFSSPRNREAIPGPGSYFHPQPFGARSVLSTPPRRR